jgi:hypothetical protein
MVLGWLDGLIFLFLLKGFPLGFYLVLYFVYAHARGIFAYLSEGEQKKWGVFTLSRIVSSLLLLAYSKDVEDILFLWWFCLPAASLLGMLDGRYDHFVQKRAKEREEKKVK